MKAELVNKLLELNRAFYTEFARPFSETRSLAQPGLWRILPHIPDRARVLDLGCGSGRLARLLDRERQRIAYVGLDFSREQIRIARAQTAHLTGVTAEFHVTDIARPGWAEPLGGRPFDCAVALAVLHHVPSSRLRVGILREVNTLLTPGGCLILSNWRFLSNARMRRKIVPWREIGVDEGELEPGDYLLDWKREGVGYRYCHLIDEAEVAELAAQSGFRVVEHFHADGREGDLSLYAVLRKRAAAPAFP